MKWLFALLLIVLSGSALAQQPPDQIDPRMKTEKALLRACMLDYQAAREKIDNPRLHRKMDPNSANGIIIQYVDGLCHGGDALPKNDPKLFDPGSVQWVQDNTKALR